MNPLIRDLVEQKIRQNILSQTGEKFKQGSIPAALFTAFELHLPETVLRQAQDLAKGLYPLKQDPNYSKAVYANSNLTDASKKALGLDSFSSCLDLHLDQTGKDLRIKLIEFNTNAALMGLSYFIYDAYGLTHSLKSSTEQMKADLLTLVEQGQELRSSDSREPKKNQAPRIAIIDSEPEKQNLFGDFLFYKALFESWGWTCEIFDTAIFSEQILKDTPAPYDLIINRDTDFFLENPKHRALKELWHKGLASLSPHPGDYALFADKLRLFEWQTNSNLSEFILKTRILSRENKEALWTERKKLIFKPSSSFGSKQVYKGSSVSKKVFEALCESSDSFLAQEFCEPLRFQIPQEDLKKLVNSGIQLETQAGGSESYSKVQEQEVKVDLRFYLFKDQVRSALARVYQGQVTNLQSPLAGFIPIVFHNGHDIQLKLKEPIL